MDWFWNEILAIPLILYGIVLFFIGAFLSDVISSIADKFFKR